MSSSSTPKAKTAKAGGHVISRKLAGDLPNRLDAHVGNRLRVRRMLAGLTQDELAMAVGITFQQVQKYEKGANRISASRLHAFSNVLNVRVSWFFDDVDAPVSDVVEPVCTEVAPLSDAEMMGTREALELVGAYWRIRTSERRKALLQLIREISD